MEIKEGIRHLKVSEASRVTGIDSERIRYLFKKDSIEGIRLNTGGIMIKVTSNGDLIYKGVVNG